jgi:hypothetical protein
MQSDDADAMLALRCGKRIISRFLPISPSTSQVLPLAVDTQGLPEWITAAAMAGAYLGRWGISFGFLSVGVFNAVGQSCDTPVSRPAFSWATVPIKCASVWTK